MDLALNNLQRLICHKTKQTKPHTLTHTYVLTRQKTHFEVSLNTATFHDKTCIHVYPFSD